MWNLCTYVQHICYMNFNTYAHRTIWKTYILHIYHIYLNMLHMCKLYVIFTWDVPSHTHSLLQEEDRIMRKEALLLKEKMGSCDTTTVSGQYTHNTHTHTLIHMHSHIQNTHSHTLTHTHSHTHTYSHTHTHSKHCVQSNVTLTWEKNVKLSVIDRYT